MTLSHVGCKGASRKALMQCATGTRACDALPFSSDSCLGATKGARFKMFPFQAAVKHSSSLQSDSACPWAHLLCCHSRKDAAELSSCILSPSSPSSPSLCYTHIKVYLRQQDRAVQIIQCYAESPLTSERFC